MMASVCVGGDYNCKFDAIWYLTTFYSSDSILLNEDAFLHTLYMELNNTGDIKDGKLLEFGCGPNIHNVFIASKKFQDITMAEYAKPNRDVVNKWLHKEEGAFDWSPFLKFTAHLEKSSPDLVAERTRSAVKEVIPCDLDNDPILLDPGRGPYDFIISSLCLEAACASAQSYTQAINSLCRLIKPGGKLFMNGVLGETYYRVKDQRFYCLPLSAEQVRGAVQAAGMTITLFEQVDSKLDTFSDHTGFFWLLAVRKSDA